MSNPITFFEIGCADSASTVEFYRSLFDWTIAPSPMGGMIDAGEGIPGQITALGHEPHQYTIFYVQVDDVVATIDRVKELGGALVVGPVPIPTGTFAWVKDPGGNTIGLWRPKG